MIEFAPKDAEVLRAEVLEDLGEEYEGNEEKIDRIVARRLKDEEFKASLHADKNKHLESKRVKEELLKKAGLNPETGEKLPQSGEGIESAKSDTLSAKDIIAIRDLHEEDAEYLIGEAKLRGKTVYEMKKDPYMSIILNTRVEERKTASITNTGGSRRQSSKSSEEELLKRVENADESLSKEEMRLASKKIVEDLLK